jgi:capsular exopolysaccharide synthesis family protein
MIAVDEPQSPYVEALRGLRTALLLSRGGAPPQVILVTSSIASEGKTTLTLNLAILLAQQGRKVLLVDADLRRPTLHRVLRTTSERGLSSLLTGHGATESDSEFIQLEQAPGLHVLTAGPVPPYPSELLGSDQMRILLERWRKQFDFILFDGAPILPVTDSVVLSELADSKLLLARFGVTERQSLLRSYSLLQRTGPKDHRISLVINAVNQSDGAYHEYYGYSESVYHQVAEGATA